MSLDQLYSLPLEAQIEILNGPALPPPPGIISNLEHPANRNSMTQAMLTFCLVITTLAMILRAYTKLLIFRKVLIEDGTSIPWCPN